MRRTAIRVNVAWPSTSATSRRKRSYTGTVERIFFVLAMPFYTIYMAFRYPAAVAKKLEMQRALRASSQQ